MNLKKNPCKKVLLILGTRPELLKLTSVYHELLKYPSLNVSVCNTGQHAELIDDVIESSGLKIEYFLNSFAGGQSPNRLLSKIVLGIETILESSKYDYGIVQGDTTTTLAGALALFNRNVPFGHVEAGLRSFDLTSPWPEEGNRQIVSRIALHHFVPSSLESANLNAESIKNSIIPVGNPIIDLLKNRYEKMVTSGELIRRLKAFSEALFKGKLVVLVTLHRRETSDNAYKRIAELLTRLLEKPNMEILVITHPNERFSKHFDLTKNRTETSGQLRLLPAQGHEDFLSLLSRADLVMTDSGGVQEEAPSLGKRVIVLRSNTERVQSLESGNASLIDPELLKMADVEALLSNQKLDVSKWVPPKFEESVYGDGKSGSRIAKFIANYLNKN